MLVTQTREYLGKQIRFVERDGSWWAVGKDVAEALGYEEPAKAIRDHVSERDKGGSVLDTPGGKQTLTVISEKGIYRLIFRSKLQAAEQFQDWVCDVLVELRKAVGLKEFEALRMLDLEIQKDAMARLKEGYRGNLTKVEYIKANKIANKAICNDWGIATSINKSEMLERAPEMVKQRDEILRDVVDAMNLNKRLDMGWSITAIIYKNHPLTKQDGANNHNASQPAEEHDAAN